MKEKLLCISFSACHPVPSRVLIISILIWIVCWSHSSILKCRLLPEEFITLLIQPDIGTHSFTWGETGGSALGRGLGCHPHRSPRDTRSSSNGRDNRSQRCSGGTAMVTPMVTFQGAPTEKWNTLFVKNQTQISVVGGFKSLSVFLVKTSEAAEHFQAFFFFFFYTQNTSGK